MSQLRRCFSEFASTNGNQGSGRRGLRKGAARMHACAHAAALREGTREAAPSSRGAGAHTRFGGSLPQGCVRSAPANACSPAPRPPQGGGAALHPSQTFARQTLEPPGVFVESTVSGATPLGGLRPAPMRNVSAKDSWLVVLSRRASPDSGSFKTSAAPTEAKLQIVKPRVVVSFWGWEDRTTDGV